MWDTRRRSVDGLRRLKCTEGDDPEPIARWKNNDLLAEGLCDDSSKPLRIEHDTFQRGHYHSQKRRRRTVQAIGKPPVIVPLEQQGKHVVVLLELARREGKTRGEIIRDWNIWVAEQRHKDSTFRLDLTCFDVRLEDWKHTPLWANNPYPYGDYRTPLPTFISRGWVEDEIFEIDFTDALLERAHLDSACFDFASLKNSNLFKATLCDARLRCADFRGAFLRGAHLEGADLSGADLDGADMAYSFLDGAEMTLVIFSNVRFLNRVGHFYGLGRSFRGVDLRGSKFESCDLSYCDFRNANLQKCSFANADVTRVTYKQHGGLWPLSLIIRFPPVRWDLMRGHYLGIRGIDSCFGSPAFRRDALDQDFIDQKFDDCLFLKANVDAIESRWFGWLLNSRPVKFLRRIRWVELHHRIPRRFLFWLWSLSDYGRSTTGVMLYVAATIGAIGGLYQYVLIPNQHVALAGSSAGLPFAAWYAAGMGAATLGLTDLMKPLDWWGQIAMFGNALSGLILFGMLIAVLQNKVARRS